MAWCAGSPSHGGAMAVTGARTGKMAMAGALTGTMAMLAPEQGNFRETVSYQQPAWLALAPALINIHRQFSFFPAFCFDFHHYCLISRTVKVADIYKKKKLLHK